MNVTFSINFDVHFMKNGRFGKMVSYQYAIRRKFVETVTAYSKFCYGKLFPCQMGDTFVVRFY